MVGLFSDGIIKAVSKDPCMMCFVFVQCLQLLGTDGIDLASLMRSDDSCF